jgi:hypothetical protein
MPRPVRVGGDAEQAHVQGLEFDDEEHVDALEGDRAVDVHEIAGERGGCVGLEEPAPGDLVTSGCHQLGCAVGSENLAVILLGTGRLAEARKAWSQSEELLRELGDTTVARSGPSPAPSSPNPGT